ncbi:MAG: D-alanyl-D-alanine carboxypeptidase [Firmicutes bacterium]|nr:D-alanyl-D-alanine carboxypeptidase [[Eubacterium] siraeum]MCM1486766.1 D-alanyl-D-alanine carboxypeptidase [Bacillota bacterium]
MKTSKAVISFFMAVIVFACGSVAVLAEEGEKKEKNLYPARSVILTEAVTGQVLYSQNPDEKLPVASVTKIMTLLIAAEELEAGSISMEDTVTASFRAFSMEGSVIWLNEGEKMSLYDIARSIVISSANDACVALAEHIAGSEDAFVQRMNKRAGELGMKNTNFVNSTGLDAEGHCSTAADVAKMAAELRKHDCYDEFLLTRLTYVREGTDRATQLLNTNRLLGYKGITGLKTGTTDNAGYCFAATAKRGDMELIAVVLGAETDEGRFDIAEKLLDYGFDGFELFSPVFDREKLQPVKAEKGVEKLIAVETEKDLRCLIPRGKSGEVEYLYNIREKVSAPVKQGDQVGKIIVLLEEDTLFVVKVTAKADCEELTFMKSLWLMWQGLLNF